MLYEQVLGIPRSELRPDLWPPDITAIPTTPPAGEEEEGSGAVVGALDF